MAESCSVVICEADVEDEPESEVTSTSPDISLPVSVLAQFNALYGNMDDGVYLVDPRHPFLPIVACNDAYLCIHETTRKECLGVEVALALALQGKGLQKGPPQEDNDDREENDVYLERLRRNGRETIHASIRAKNGTVRSLECTHEPFTLSGQEYIVVIDRWLQEEPTLKKEKITAFQEFFRHVPDAALLIDMTAPGCPVVDCNRRYLQMIGYRSEEVIGLTAPDLSTAQDPERYRQILPSLPTYFESLLNRDSVTYEGRLRRKDGSLGIIQVLQYAVQVDGKHLAMTLVHDKAADEQRNTLDRDRNRVLEFIARDAPLEESLRTLAFLTENQIEASLCSIFLYRSGRLFNGAAPNLPANAFLPPEGIDVALTIGPLSEAASLRQAVIIENLSTLSPVLQRRDSGIPNRSGACWAFPIIGGNDLLGIMAVYPSETRRPTTEEVSLVNIALRLAVIAIEQRQLSDRLAHQAEHDMLTGLPNRLLFQDRLAQALALAQRYGSKASLCFLDLDGFKKVNDTLGHAAGDALLCEVARRLQKCVRASDTVARIGGDEFTLVLGDLVDSSGTLVIVRKIIETLQKPVFIAENEVCVTVSLGVAVFPDDGIDMQTLTRNADTAMYRAKERGKNRFEVYSDV
jgi:diguanylate cyclase (GGDEF)-like protein/PAS domain S-box-containing protein